MGEKRRTLDIYGIVILYLVGRGWVGGEREVYLVSTVFGKPARYITIDFSSTLIHTECYLYGEGISLSPVAPKWLHTPAQDFSIYGLC